ncbi:MAG: hypothetical protein HC927_11255 [Deltaproteobacteria bacterium]|nr:hypothetical protein [Deltaproteobacteria bacterium]
MMSLVPPPSDWDNVADFDEIAASKRKDKALLEDLRGSIVASYRRYRERAPEFDFAPASLDEEQRKALRECYAPNLRTNACASMLERLYRLNHGRFDCPLCGIGEHTTWDHYLPQATFPEFAVCVYNLVRSCASCNERRVDRWRGTQGRLILHMYYDAIEQEELLLEANVNVIGQELRVAYRLRSSADDPGHAGRFARHCETLGLLSRFERAARACLYDYVDDLRGHVEPATIVARLERTALLRARRYGLNHWQPALYRGAATSTSFIRYIIQGTAP